MDGADDDPLHIRSGSSAVTDAAGGAGLPQNTQATGYSYAITITRPSELLRHDISDEELESLAEMKRDYLWEGMWVALGLCIGVAPNAVQFLWTYKPSAPASPSDLIHVIAFFCSLLVFCLLAYLMRTKSRDVKSLVKAIRERTNHRVQSVAG